MYGSIAMFGTYFTGDWWMFFTILVIGVIQLFTISGAFILTINEIAKDNSLKLWYEGAFSTFVPLVVIIYFIPIIGFFVQLFKTEPRYENITILTVALSLFALLCVISVSFADAPISTKDVKEKAFKIGFLTMSLILVFSISLPYIIYGVEESGYKAKNEKSLALYQGRKKMNQRLGFKGVYLGEEWSSVSKKIYSDTTWNWRVQNGYLQYSNEKDSTKIDTTVYKGNIMSSYEDSVFTQPMMEAYTSFDGYESLIRFYLINHKVAAISVQTSETEDSIVKMYSNKYGEVEKTYAIPTKAPSLVDLFIYQRWYMFDFGQITQYQWTLGNNYIIYSPNEYHMGGVFYVSDNYLNYLTQKEEEDRNKFEESLRQDSLKRVRELNEKVKVQKEREENAKKEHQRTINDI